MNIHCIHYFCYETYTGESGRQLLVCRNNIYTPFLDASTTNHRIETDNTKIFIMEINTINGNLKISASMLPNTNSKGALSDRTSFNISLANIQEGEINLTSRTI